MSNFGQNQLIMETIRVAIADDHKLFRKGVILCMEAFPNIKIVQEAENGDELVNGIEETHPDVVLMDLHMPVKDGLETTKAIHKKYPNIKVLVLSMCEDEKMVYYLMENGASGYLLKNSEPLEIQKAITEVSEKGYYQNSFVDLILAKKSLSRKNAEISLHNETPLNPKEKEVLRLICLEFTAHEIARIMEISPRTVEAIKDRLMERYGCKNTPGLVYYAAKNDLFY